jgi:hypothetical protein
MLTNGLFFAIVFVATNGAWTCHVCVCVFGEESRFLKRGCCFLSCF